MRQPLAQRLDGWARGLMPTLSVLFLVLMSAVPSGLPNFAGTSPCYSIIGVFYWSVFRPDLLPAAVVFMAGLLQDILLGALGPQRAGTVGAGSPSASAEVLGRPFYILWFGFLAI